MMLSWYESENAQLRKSTSDESLRATFGGIVMSACENCGDCPDDDDGLCPCGRIVEELIAAVRRLEEDPD